MSVVLELLLVAVLAGLLAWKAHHEADVNTRRALVYTVCVTLWADTRRWEEAFERAAETIRSAGWMMDESGEAALRASAAMRAFDCSMTRFDRTDPAGYGLPDPPETL